jgi:hypothetical protein
VASIFQQHRDGTFDWHETQNRLNAELKQYSQIEGVGQRAVGWRWRLGCKGSWTVQGRGRPRAVAPGEIEQFLAFLLTYGL